MVCGYSHPRESQRECLTEVRTEAVVVAAMVLVGEGVMEEMEAVEVVGMARVEVMVVVDREAMAKTSK